MANHLNHSQYFLLVVIITISGFECDGKVCSSTFCKREEYCIMKVTPCANKTCPKIASCISKEHVCSTSFPYLDETSAVIPCLESSDVCPDMYKCQSEYCCVDVDQPSIDDDIENIGAEDNVDDSIPFLNDIFGPLDVDSVQDCKPCEVPRCDVQDCSYPEPVICVPDNCSCTVTYEDLTGNPVKCEIPDGGFPFIPGIAVNVAPDELDMVVTEMPITFSTKLITVSSTKKEPLTRESSSSENSKNTTAIFVIGAFGVLILLTAIGFAAYKIYTARITKQNQKIDKDINEVKVPLKGMSTHNNNEVKITENLTNGSTGEDP